jgi:hypothetical protein
MRSDESGLVVRLRGNSDDMLAYRLRIAPARIVAGKTSVTTAGNSRAASCGTLRSISAKARCDRRLPQFAERLDLNLTHALAGHTQTPADHVK